MSPEVFVIGGGPAGATAARLLAAWGWSVHLAHRQVERPSLAESLPPSTRKLLAFLGQLETVGAAPFHPNHGNVAHWAGAARDTPTTDAGFHVSRASFDALLRISAREAGVTIIDAVVRSVQLGDAPRVTYLSAAGDRVVSRDVAPRIVLDCSGRAGIVARRGFRRNDVPYRTLAIAAEWESTDWPGSESTRTMVESYGDGWAWSVPLSSTRRQCTVMIDPGSVKAARDGAPPDRALQQVYTRALARATDLQSRLKGARQMSNPWGTHASLYHAPTPCDRGLLLVGDAASFIEPLSSAGVKKAITSGWRAAVVANTCLSNPDMSSSALAFYAQREREVYAECQQIARGFFAEAAAFHDTTYWHSRAIAPTTQESDDAAGINEAHARLRRAARVRLRPSAALRFDTTPDIEGREVVLRDAIVPPGANAPIRFAAGVNLPALVRLAAECDDVPAIFSAYHAHVGPAAVDSLITGLSLLVARHALILEDAR
jgi:flavin-dependent dehydrogenase